MKKIQPQSQFKEMQITTMPVYYFSLINWQDLKSTITYYYTGKTMGNRHSFELLVKICPTYIEGNLAIRFTFSPSNCTLGTTL